MENKYNHYIRCPYCGHHHTSDLTERFNGDGDETEWECGKCEETFKATMDLDITFCTEKIEAAEGEGK